MSDWSLEPYTEYKIPDSLSRVVVGFYSDTNTRFCGFEFYDRQGIKLLSVGRIRYQVETILDDDERLVGIASRAALYARHFDF